MKADDFYQILQAHQQKVRSVFDALIGEEKDERSDDNNRWIDFLESDLDDIEQMLVDNHIDEDAISDILDKLIQFKRAFTPSYWLSWSRSFSSLIAKYLHSNI